MKNIVLNFNSVFPSGRYYSYYCEVGGHYYSYHSYYNEVTKISMFTVCA